MRHKLPLKQKWQFVGVTQALITIATFNIPYSAVNASVWYAPHLANLRDWYWVIAIVFTAYYIYHTHHIAESKKNLLISQCEILSIPANQIARLYSMPLDYFDELSFKSIERAIECEDSIRDGKLLTSLSQSSQIVRIFSKEEN